MAVESALARTKASRNMERGEGYVKVGTGDRTGRKAASSILPMSYWGIQINRRGTPPYPESYQKQVDLQRALTSANDAVESMAGRIAGSGRETPGRASWRYARKVGCLGSWVALALDLACSHRLTGWTSNMTLPFSLEASDLSSAFSAFSGR